MIEVGDTVEVLSNTTKGYEVGTVAKVIRIDKDYYASGNDVYRIVSENEHYQLLIERGYGHYKSELKLIHKGTK